MWSTWVSCLKASTLLNVQEYCKKKQVLIHRPTLPNSNMRMQCRARILDFHIVEQHQNLSHPLSLVCSSTLLNRGNYLQSLTHSAVRSASERSFSWAQRGIDITPTLAGFKLVRADRVGGIRATPERSQVRRSLSVRESVWFHCQPRHHWVNSLCLCVCVCVCVRVCMQWYTLPPFMSNL